MWWGDWRFNCVKLAVGVYIWKGRSGAWSEDNRNTGHNEPSV